MKTTLSEAAPMVLHVRTVHGHGGGPEKTILNSPRFLHQAGYRSRILYLHPPGDKSVESLSRRAEGLTDELDFMEDRGQFDIGLVGRLADYCKTHSVSLWHAHDDKTNALGVAVRRRHPMKLVTTCHGWVAKATFKTRIHGLISKSCLPFYDSIITVSEDLSDVVRRWFVPERRLNQINNAIDTEQFRRTLAPQSARERMQDLPKTKVLFVGLGRLAVEKGFGELIDCVAQLRRENHDVGLAIGGEGTLREELQQQINGLGLSEEIRLLGQVADPRTLLQAADIFVLSSLREGLPNVVLEAMALETPVVSTRVAGVPKLITDGEQGLLVDIGSASQLLDAVKRMMDDNSLRESLIKQARQRIEERFSFRSRMQSVTNIYDGLLGFESRNLMNLGSDSVGSELSSVAEQ